MTATLNQTSQANDRSLESLPSDDMDAAAATYTRTGEQLVALEAPERNQFRSA